MQPQDGGMGNEPAGRAQFGLVEFNGSDAVGGTSLQIESAAVDRFRTAFLRQLELGQCGTDHIWKFALEQYEIFTI